MQYEGALRLCRELGNGRLEGVILDSLGEIYHLHGRPERAVSTLKVALDIGRQLDTPREVASMLRHLGRLFGDLGQTAQAHERLSGSLSIFQDLGVDHDQGLALKAMSDLYSDGANQELAASLWREALEKLSPESAEFRAVHARLQAVEADV